MNSLLVASLFAAAVSFTPGQSDIVIAPDACEAVQVAADEAREFLSQSLGAPVPVVNAPRPGRAALILGDNAWSRAVGLAVKDLARDAYRIRTGADGSAVYVVGQDDPKGHARLARTRLGYGVNNFERATTFGVYEFLERFVGVRFYFPGELGTIVPRHDRIDVPETDLLDGPVNTVRRFSIDDRGLWFTGPADVGTRHPDKALNWWRYRMETENLPCCHGQNKFHYMERFAKSHPEYFLLLPDGRRHNSLRVTTHGHPGQLCHTSGVWEEIYQDVKSYLTGEPASVRGIFPGEAPTFHPRSGKPVYGWGPNCKDRKYVDIMPQDGMAKCFCPNCQARYAKASEVYWASDLIWSNVTALARRLKAEGVKGHVTMMAYSRYREVPRYDIPDNIDVMVAERGPFAEGNPKELAREVNEVKAWYDKLGGRKVWMWTYVHKYRKLWQPGIILSTPRAIGRYFQRLAPYIFGAYMECEIDRSFPGLINQYVFSKVMWNPGTDVEALLDEYALLMFGPAAPEMARFLARCEEIWIGQLVGSFSETSIGPQPDPPTPEEMYTKVYSPAVIAEFEGLFAAAERKVAAGSLEARRLALVRRETLDELKRTIAAFNAKRAAFVSFRVPAGADASRRILVDTVVSKNRVRSVAPVKTWVNTWKANDRLHVVFDCEEPMMDDTGALPRRKGDPLVWTDNSVELFINPSGDRTNYYQLLLTSAGSTAFIAHLRINGERVLDRDWDPGAETRATRTPTGWRAEFAIPLAALPGLKDAVPMNFCRDRALSTGTTNILWGDYPDTFWDVGHYGTVEF